MQDTRTDSDSLGPVTLGAGALYGASTLRAHRNFDISACKLADLPALLTALVRIKIAAAQANLELGTLPRAIAEAIDGAGHEIILGAHRDQFIVDILEGSGGTSINMNVNEVLANRSGQILGHRPGQDGPVHPNDHVNLGQSTNDVVPAALKLAIHYDTAPLVTALTDLADALEDRARAHRNVLRVGRTCLQAAQPMRLGQALGGYAAGIRRATAKIEAARSDLLVLPLGCTAIGTGLGAAAGFRDLVHDRLSDLLGQTVTAAPDSFDAMQSADGFARLSSELRICAEMIARLAGDLILLSSDTGSGIGELRLPVVQPGSSIMPGKINPVMPIMMQQVAFAVVGNDATVSLATMSGQLEINHFEPVIASRLLDSVSILTRGSRLFTERCIAGLEADAGRALDNLRRSPAIATAFVPRLGYAETARQVRAAEAEGRSFIDRAVTEGLVNETEVMSIIEQSAGPA